MSGASWLEKLKQKNITDVNKQTSEIENICSKHVLKTRGSTSHSYYYYASVLKMYPDNDSKYLIQMSNG